MARVIWKSLWLTPVLIGAATLASTAQVNAQSAPSQPSTLDQISAYGSEGRGNSLSQVTSVSQFSDVRPTDWAFQALQSLVERYGCIVGYPDKTYRGNRALTRYEFAAGLNACLDKIQELIAAATADFVRKEDLEVIKRLQEEFAAELSALRGRVEALEVRTATLEKQQFSTTTKLAGEVIFSVADTFGDRAIFTGNDSFLSGVDARNRRDLEDDRTETIFGNRVRLSFDSSFTGRDRLRTRLNASNITPFSGTFTGTNETRLSVDGITGSGNAVEIDKLFYRFPVGQSLRVQIDAINLEYYDGLVSALSPFESSGQAAVSRFGRFNPVYRSNAPGNVGSAGITFDYAFSPQLSLQGGFSADRASNDPGTKNGIFNGDFTAIGQLVFRPSRAFDIGLTYVRAYYPGSNTGLGANPFNQPAPNLTGSTGTGYAANPFAGEATASNNFAAQVQWRLTPAITIGGWYGYSFAGNRRTSEEARIQNWAAFLAFPDLGRKGNLGGILFGMQPRVVDNDFRARFTTGPNRGLPNPNIRRRLDEDPPFHLEAFYRFRVNDNISITPGAFVLFNPEGNSANDTQFVGVIRTTFTF
ncbi:'Carbohydrate-selective porin, OprB family',S-layer domain containing protein [Leptolyngbyaceae cyanobacterium JSC-12]|nr:'Carbohydrate-selective porin, OprB family',S-layer domain containing protein [Leptolyngbyaceae cyanobacterium JSC-12]